MGQGPLDLLKGTLDLMILKTLSWAPAHGYGIARWIEQCTDDVLQVEEGSLYPALYKLEEAGLIVADWGITENNRRAKFYRLTAGGQKQPRVPHDSDPAHRRARAGPPLRRTHASPPEGMDHGRRPHAGTRHRRQLGDVQRRQSSVAQSHFVSQRRSRRAAVPGAESGQQHGHAR